MLEGLCKEDELKWSKNEVLEHWVEVGSVEVCGYSVFYQLGMTLIMIQWLPQISEIL